MIVPWWWLILTGAYFVAGGIGATKVRWAPRPLAQAFTFMGYMFLMGQLWWPWPAFDTPHSWVFYLFHGADFLIALVVSVWLTGFVFKRIESAPRR